MVNWREWPIIGKWIKGRDNGETHSNPFLYFQWGERTWAALEVILAVLIGIALFSCVAKSEVVGLTTKLFQLGIATFSTGALIYGWMRWHSGSNFEANKVRFVSVPPSFAGLIWLGWLTLTVVGWTVFGQNLWWNLSMDRPSVVTSAENLKTEHGETSIKSVSAYGEPSTSHGESVKAHSGEEPKVGEYLVIYVAALTLIAAIVTSYYFALLDKVTDRAERAAEKADEQAKRATNALDTVKEEVDKTVSKAEESVSRMLESHFKFLDQNILSPLVAYLVVSSSTKSETPTKAIEEIEKMVELLEAEIVLFNLLEAENCEEFLIIWKAVKANESVYQRCDYRHLFRYATKHLSKLSSEEDERKIPPEVKRVQNQIEKFLLDYEVRGWL